MHPETGEWEATYYETGRSTMKPHQRIEELREAGFEVEVTHRRVAWGSTGWPLDDAHEHDPRFRQGIRMLTLRELRDRGLEPQPTGGITEVVILRDGREVATGEATCSLLDVFSRKRGLAIAVGRAEKARLSLPAS